MVFQEDWLRFFPQKADESGDAADFFSINRLGRKDPKTAAASEETDQEEKQQHILELLHYPAASLGLTLTVRLQIVFFLFKRNDERFYFGAGFLYGIRLNNYLLFFIVLLACILVPGIIVMLQQ